MCSEDPSQWPIHDLPTVPGEDFSNFFNFSDIQLDLPSDFESTGRDDDDDAHSQHTAMDTDFPGTDDVARKEHRLLSGEDMLGMRFHDPNTMGQPQRQHHVSMHHHSMIPPTPSSIDLQTGLPISYTHGMDADLMMDRFNSMRDEQVASDSYLLKLFCANVMFTDVFFFKRYFSHRLSLRQLPLLIQILSTIYLRL